MKYFAIIAILIYDLILVGGTAYLVQEHGWSMWTFLLTLCFFLTTKDPEPEKKEPVEEKRIIV